MQRFVAALIAVVSVVLAATVVEAFSFFSTANRRCSSDTRMTTSDTSDTAFAIHNFGPVSSRDTVLYTAERPGNPPGKTDPVSDEQVQEWISFMQTQGITHVIALLDDNEFSNYNDLLQLYSDGGLQCLVQPMRDDDAATTILERIRYASEAGEKVVAHCTGGIGRAGRVAAGWLVENYGLSPEEATQETLAQARKSRVIRKGSPELLEAWLQQGGK